MAKSDGSIGKDVLFDAVFGRSSEGILLVQFDGVIEKANPAVSVIFGYSLIELEGRSVDDLAHINDRHKRAPEVQQLIEGKVDCIRANRLFKTSIGQVVTLSMRTYPIHKAGEVVRLLVFLWPITQDPQILTDSIQARLTQMEELLEQHGKPEEWRMVNNIHLGDDVGGDKSGRDKITIANDTKVFYFVGAVLIAIVSMLGYIGYLVTFPSHGGDAVPPPAHERIEP